MFGRIISGGLLLVGLCAAQQWEVGGQAGYGIYRNATVFSRAGTATAGIRNRFTLSAFLTENRFKRVSGELRYLYQDGDPFIATANQKTNVEGQSHAIHYDALIQLKTWRTKWRFYGAIGGGAKIYRVSGPVDPKQPLAAYALFRQGIDAQPLVTFGAGLKYQLRETMYLRVDFRDYLTPFPGGIIAPAANGNIRGLMHQFTPLVGVSWAP